MEFSTSRVSAREAEGACTFRSASITRRTAMALAASSLAAPRAGFAAANDTRLIWACHIALAPVWFDPAETPGIITPFMVLYAMHDALLKPMPGEAMAPSLARAWSAAPDGLSYEFELRPGARFHNGDPVTAADVAFSFERYHGTAAAQMKSRVARVETPADDRVRFVLKAPWPDFMTFYTAATGAGWIVPKKYVEAVGEDGFRKAPIGAGPYRFVSFTPGVELVLQAFEGYWRRPPQVKRIILKVIPDETTRLAALKRGEVDIAYSIRGELAEEMQATPGLSLKAVVLNGTQWIYFPDQWKPDSPWHDIRVRQALRLALDLKTINEALTLGHSAITNSIIPRSFEYFWQPPPAVYDPAAAKRLLAEAGFAGGFDGGDFNCDASYSNVTEVAINNLREVGIRTVMRPLERAGFINAYAEKKLSGLLYGGSGAFGNAATRLDAFVATGGTYAYGGFPDIDALLAEQANETDHARRAALLGQAQKLVHERSIYAPIWQLGFINGVGTRVGESGLGLIDGYPYSAPYEEVSVAVA
jgi:peptide/nickel transport system substrate-binding protein